MLILEVIGWAMMSLSAILLALAGSAGVFLQPDGSVTMGGDPRLPTQEARKAANIRRYKWQRFGGPVGWAFFGAGSLCQLLAVLLK